MPEFVCVFVCVWKIYYRFACMHTNLCMHSPLLLTSSKVEASNSRKFCRHTLCIQGDDSRFPVTQRACVFGRSHYLMNVYWQRVRFDTNFKKRIDCKNSMRVIDAHKDHRLELVCGMRTSQTGCLRWLNSVLGKGNDCSLHLDNLR